MFRHVSAFGKLSACLLVLGMFALTVFPALAAESFMEKADLTPVMRTDAMTAPLRVTLGKAELVDVGGQVADVMVANSAIVDVSAIQANRLYVVGLNVGDTNLIALDAQGDVIKRLDIHVAYDLQAIQNMVNDLFPDEHVNVSAIHDQVILTGTASTPDTASRIADLVSHYVSDLQDKQATTDELISNLLKIRGEQQVMLQVRIVEAKRNILSQYQLGSTLDGAGGETTRYLSATGAGLGFGQDAVGTINIIRDTGINGLGFWDLQLDALENEGLVNILAQPNLTAVSGEQAGFLAGGEFPVPVGRDQVGNIVIEFREFGVSLNFKPKVLSDTRISMQLNTEVSSLDSENAITLAELEVPGLNVRRASTTVEVPSGGSLMIAGLLQSEALKGMKGLPGIRNTPVIGDLISSKSFERNETELVVIVTPYLVEPYADKKRADPVPKHANNPLATTFVDNIKRIYGMDNKDLMTTKEPVGYLLQ